MSFITIVFQAYIPKSLGKPLLSYFENDPFFTPQKMQNYADFRSKLAGAALHGDTWIPEPLVGAVLKTYFATDNVDFHSDNQAHTARLKIQGKFDLSKVGKFTDADKKKLFFDMHKNKIYYRQHSDYSRKVRAGISPSLINVGGRLLPDYNHCTGFFSELTPKRSDELKINAVLKNTLTGTVFTSPGTNRASLYDTTIIDVSGSAGYPYLEPASPNIDLSLKLKFVKTGNYVSLTINGEHDKFPAYELIVNNKVLYCYNPAKNGFKGPNPYNLNSSVKFQTSVIVKNVFPAPIPSVWSK